MIGFKEDGKEPEQMNKMFILVCILNGYCRAFQKSELDSKVLREALAPSALILWGGLCASIKKYSANPAFSETATSLLKSLIYSANDYLVLAVKTLNIVWTSL